MSKLTQEQKNAIYCVKYGHSKIVSACFGYINCERCGQQLGDTLASTYNLDDHVVIGHVGRQLNGCNCTENYRNLPAVDKKHIDQKVIAELDEALKAATS